MNILSSKNTTETKTKTEHGHITAQVTVYGASGGASLSGSYDQNQATDKATTINNSQLNADTITLTTSNDDVHGCTNVAAAGCRGGDLNLMGGNVRAEDHLEVDVGGNMNLESQQNRSNSRNTGFGVSGGMSFGGTAESGTKKNADGSANHNQSLVDVGSASGVNGGINTSNGMSMTRETVLTSMTSGGTANVNVKGTTYNTGALLATTDADGKDLGKLNFETGDYVSTDLRNIKQNNQTSVGVSTNIGIKGAKADNEDAAENNSTTKTTPTTKTAEGDNPRKGQQIAEGANGKTLSAQTSNLTYSNTNENSASKSLATLGHGNITVGGVQLERDGELTEAGKAEGSPLIGINRNTEETEKTLWDSSQSQTVDATLDHRLLNEAGRTAIKNDFVDSAEFGQDIARATSAVKKDENLNITDFWKTLDNNTKATQIKNELVRDPANAQLLEGLKSENPDDFAQAFAQLGELAQEKFGIDSDEFGEIFLYDGSKTTSTSLLGAGTKGGIVTDKKNEQYGNIFVNTNSGIKTDMVNTLGHETVELFTLTTNGKNDATQEAQAGVFGEQFSNRINQAAGSNLDSTGGSNFGYNLNNNWSVMSGTFEANNVGDATVDHRNTLSPTRPTLGGLITSLLSNSTNTHQQDPTSQLLDPLDPLAQAPQNTFELELSLDNSPIGNFFASFKTEEEVYGRSLSQNEIFDRLKPGQAYERNGTFYMVSNDGSMLVSPNLPSSGTEFTVLDPYELGGNTSAGGFQPTTLEPITTLPFPIAENLPTTLSNPIQEDLGGNTLINPISDFEHPLNTAGGNGTPVETVTVMMAESFGEQIKVYPDGSHRTPDGKFASKSGEAAPGTMKANEFAEFLKTNGMDVVGTEIVVQGPVGDRRYDIVVRDQNGKLHGIEVKSGSASKDSYQRFTDYFINQFGADGKGRVTGERIESATTIYVP